MADISRLKLVKIGLIFVTSLADWTMLVTYSVVISIDNLHAATVNGSFVPMIHPATASEPCCLGFDMSLNISTEETNVADSVLLDSLKVLGASYWICLMLLFCHYGLLSDPDRAWQQKCCSDLVFGRRCVSFPIFQYS